MSLCDLPPLRGPTSFLPAVVACELSHRHCPLPQSSWSRLCPPAIRRLATLYPISYSSPFHPSPPCPESHAHGAALARAIGYEKAAAIAKHAHAHGLPLREAALACGVEAAQYDALVRYDAMLAPFQLPK